MKKIDLTKGKVISVITMLALPIMGSSLLQFTYNIIDMMWVGKLGSNAVASIGSSSLYVNIGNAISSLAIIGCGIKVAHSIGRKDDKGVKEYINAGIVLNAVIAIIFGLVLICAGKGFIGFLNLRNEEVERDAYYYLAVNAPILLFAFFNMMFTRIMNSFGNNKLAFRINAVGVVLNIFLDPMCIYNFKLGVVGAAVSTLIANIIMFVLFMINTDGVLKYKKEIGVNTDKVKEIAKLGFPMAFQRVLFTLINIILAKIIAIFGSDAIAAQKIGVQIESVAFMIVGGFNGAVAGFTGQNYGAKKYERIKEGYKSALIIGISYAFIMASLFLMFNKPIIRIFINDEATIKIASSYLKVVAFSQAFSAVEMISNGLFTGIGKPRIPAIISIMFTTMRIPCALVLIKPFGINGIWMSICITSVLKGICSYSVYEIKIRRSFLN